MITATIHRNADIDDLVGRMLNKLNELGYRGDLDDDETRRLEAAIHQAGQDHLRGYPFVVFERAVRKFYDYYIEKGVKR